MGGGSGSWSQTVGVGARQWELGSCEHEENDKKKDVGTA